MPHDINPSLTPNIHKLEPLKQNEEENEKEISEEELPEGRDTLSEGPGNKIHPELIDAGKNVKGTLVAGALRRQQFGAIFEKRAITVSRSIKAGCKFERRFFYCSILTFFSQDFQTINFSSFSDIL